MKRILIISIAALFLLGCSQKHRTDALTTPNARLDSNGAVYVALPADGAFGSKIYAGSGRAVAIATTAAVAKHTNRVETATRLESAEEMFVTAKSMGARYVVQPQILHWEDRNTEWSGRPDRITIKILAWDVDSRRDIASTIASASSKWGTFGGDHPEDLLPQTIENFVNVLY